MPFLADGTSQFCQVPMEVCNELETDGNPPEMDHLLGGFSVILSGKIVAGENPPAEALPARSYLPVSMLLPVAVLAGSVGGLYVYDVGAQGRGTGGSL